MVLIGAILILFLLYSILIIYYWVAWKSIPEYRPAIIHPQTKISVIIPARNEEENIEKLLRALQKQTYPKEHFEVIVVDDHSTDQTTPIVKLFPEVKLISLHDDQLNSYKKKAIEKGIETATGKLIVTTDADCVPQPSWLRLLSSFHDEKQAVLIAAPVVIECNNSVLQIFQAMDFMVLQGITGAAVARGSLSMCNGANLAYERNAFFKVNGFEGIDKIASGDDMLLMHKINKAYPGKVNYLKSTETIVSTQPMKTWKQFFNQRIRWASKATYFDDKRIFFVLLLVYLFNFSFLVLAVAGFFNWCFWIWLGALWIAKTLVEFPFFISVSKFFNHSWANKMFFFFQPLHIFYTVISGLFSQFGKYEWKGRKVK